MQIRKTCLALLAALLVGVPQLAWPCSEGEPDPIWWFTKHPDLPLQPFARGDLGIVQPSFAPSYLVVAYLYLRGRTLTPAEQESLFDLWSHRLGPMNARGAEPREPWEPYKAVKDWQEARAEVMAVAVQTRIDMHRTTAEYSTYLNCPDAAFFTAAATLRERTRAYGVTSSRTRAWIEAQDQVFANCRQETVRTIPPPLVAGDALAMADRAYQIAAAHLYAGDNEDAERLFRAIAADAGSPWQKWGRYLAVRTIVRRATLTAGRPSSELLSQAQAELDAILKGNPPADMRRVVRNLRDRVSCALAPLDQAHALAARILKAEGDDELGHLVGDYTFALEQTQQMWPHMDRSYGDIDDLTRWVMTFHLRESSEEAGTRLVDALARWRTTRSVPWLVAVMSWIPADHAEAEAVLEASRAVPFAAPGGATLMYHRLRLMIAKGQHARARVILDGLLKKHADAMGKSVRNMFLDQRVQVAADLADLNAHLPRALVAWGFETNGELPDERADASLSPSTSPLGARLVSGLPLAQLRRLALGATGTDDLRQEIALGAWVRALVLEDVHTMTMLEKRFPAIAPPVARSSRPLARLLRLMKTPHPPWVLPEGFLRKNGSWAPGTSPDGIGWWCGAGGEYTTMQPQPPAFLGQQATKRARDEWAKVVAAGSGPEFFARSAIRWAHEAPDDPGVPEALHLAVASTRWACRSGGLGEVSQKAFRLLRRQYGQTVWAKKTKYWYAGRW